MSLCHRTDHLGAGLTLCLQKRSNFITVSKLNSFTSVFSQHGLNVRKELPSPSDYRLLNLRARAPKCQFEPFSLISLSGFLWLQCGRQVKSCFLFLDLGHAWSRRCQGESIWKMQALVYFVEVFFSLHEQSILKVESDCLPEIEFLLSSGLGRSHRCHRAMRWWDLE